MKKIVYACLTLLITLHALPAHASDAAVFADYLYWQASEETASYWSSDIDETATKTLVFSPKNTRFDPHHGVRLGFMLPAKPQAWDTKMAWTYFSTSAADDHHVASQIILPEFFSGFTSGNFFFGADMDWKLAMHSLNLETGHPFMLGKSFTLRPAIGLQASYIKQTINVDWDAAVYTSTEKVTQKNVSAGPTIGLDGQWDFATEFSLLGSIRTAFLWGNWNVKDVYKRPYALLGVITPTTITTELHDSELGTLMVDAIIGAQWQHHGEFTTAVRVGYEMQYWANQLRLTTFQQLPEHGDLTFQGVTCGIQLYF